MTDFQKARLVPVTGETAKEIEFMFNPTELKFSRSIEIEQAKGSTTKKGENQTSFKHPNPYQLTISNVILDTYEKPEGKRNVLEPLKLFTDALAYVKEGGGKGNSEGKSKRPPIYRFTWGGNAYLRCFIKTCNFRLTMFLPDGTPVRAILDLTLEQVDTSKKEPSQGTPKIGQAQRKSQGRPGLDLPEDEVETLYN
ncbi:hypothetical protein [Trichocoleus sp. FACHB-262]|uniref:CIS tube protein n=1 Tax=Trichocoleus sp. FACHB-262 TaxID=2692869 RepID=UPI0016852B93|nr:hypothetical protein [Trichocoleus sp. FACHB-262]MBD2123533.1 hypothetical protein [Trichocoleus sp. FACHB-262]